MLHSRAVDFVKTGIPAELPKKLQPTEWPDFMEKPNVREYRSRKPLGQIFRRVDKVEFNPLCDGNFDKRILDRYSIDEKTLETARRIKSEYDTAMKRLMNQRDIGSEFEIWTGFALSRPRVGSDYKQSEDLGREANALRQTFREACYEAAGGKLTEEIAPFVAAMYWVTDEEFRIFKEGRENLKKERPDVAEHDKVRHMPLISFPWLFHNVLGRIATDGEVRREVKDIVDLPPERIRMHRTTMADGDEETRVVAKDLGATDLGDGRIVHRGQILNVFGSTLDDVVLEDQTREKHFMDRALGRSMDEGLSWADQVEEDLLGFSHDESDPAGKEPVDQKGKSDKDGKPLGVTSTLNSTSHELDSTLLTNMEADGQRRILPMPSSQGTCGWKASASAASRDSNDGYYSAEGLSSSRTTPTLPAVLPVSLVEEPSDQTGCDTLMDEAISIEPEEENAMDRLMDLLG